MEFKDSELNALLAGVSIPPDQSELLQVLKEAHTLCGGLSAETQQQIAKTLQISPALIAALIKVTPRLRTLAAKHTVVVCLGDCCRKGGSYALLKAVQRTLGIETGQQTTDGVFRLETRSCFKQCATAPNLSIDGEIFSGLTPSDIPSLLQRFRNP